MISCILEVFYAQLRTTLISRFHPKILLTSASNFGQYPQIVLPYQNIRVKRDGQQSHVKPVDIARERVQAEQPEANPAVKMDID